MDEILKKINESYELKSKLNKSLQIEDKTAVLYDELSFSMRFCHEFKDRFLLEYGNYVAFALSASSCSALGFLLRKPFILKQFAMKNMLTIGFPIMFGCASAYVQQYHMVKLFKLDQVCEKCYQLKTIATISTLPLLNHFLFVSLLLWVRDTEVKNAEVFAHEKFKSKKAFVFALLKSYKAKFLKFKLPARFLSVLVVSSVFAYLYVLEQQDEFAKVFTNYYENLCFETEQNRQGLFLDKDAYI